MPLSKAQSTKVDIEFSYSMRVEDDFLVTITAPDSSEILQYDSREDNVPFYRNSIFISEEGNYSIKLAYSNSDSSKNTALVHSFVYKKGIASVKLEIRCLWDTITYKPEKVYRSNRISVYTYTDNNIAKLQLKRLWTTPLNGEQLYLPYEIYNPSNMTLYSNKDNGVEMSLEAFLNGNWWYQNCGGVIRLGKPFKPLQRYKLQNSGFVNACDLNYLKGKTRLRVRASYNLSKSDALMLKREPQKEAHHYFSTFETYQVIDEFSL